jgi:predicted MFS family arabinose efflux permease
MAVLGVTGVTNVVTFAIPYVLDAIMRLSSVPADVATYATTAEIAAIALSMLVVSFNLHRLNPRIGVMIGAAIALASQVLTLHSSTFVGLVGARFSAGIGEGLCLAIPYALIAQLRDGAKLFSVQFFLAVAFALCAFLSIPVLEDTWGPSAIFGILGLCATVSLLLSRFIPSIKLQRSSGTAHALFQRKGAALFGAVLIGSIGANTLWLYYAAVGERAGIPLDALVKLGSVATLPTLLVPWISYQIYKRFRSIVPVCVLFIGFTALAYLYVRVTGHTSFASVITLMNVATVAIIVFTRMLAADADSTGGLSSALGSADLTGMVVGPLIAAMTLNLRSGFLDLGTFASVVFLVALVPSLIFNKAHGGRSAPQLGDATAQGS